MASRIKDRGGGGAKVVAFKPQKFLPEKENTPVEKKPSSRKITSSFSGGKENVRSSSAGRAAPSADAPGLRWSTSSLPRRSVVPSAGLRGSRDHGLSTGPERRSFDAAATAACRASKVVESRRSSGFSGSKNPSSKINGTLQKCGGKFADLDLGSVDRSRKAKLDSKNLYVKALKPFQANGTLNVSKAMDSLRKPGSRNVGADLGTAERSLKGRLVSTAIKPSTDVTLKEVKYAQESVILKATAKADDAKRHQLRVPPLKQENVSVCDVKKVFLKTDKDLLKEKENGVPSLNPALETVTDFLAKSDAHEPVKCKDSVVFSSRVRDVIRLMDNKNAFVQNAVNQKESKEKSAHGVPVSVHSDLKKNDLDVKYTDEISKYPSKLHEKLALLEGKVQKIALDIKKTKEMLDQNNTNDSKAILSDIQSKISGLEKAVDQVMVGKKGDSSSSQSSRHADLLAKMGDTSCKVLNHEELEARFFPHHRLLKSQVSLCDSGEQARCSNGNSSKQSGNSDLRGRSLNPTEENTIEGEFLASLKVDNDESTKITGSLQLEVSAVKKMALDENASSSVDGASRTVRFSQSEEIDLAADEKLEDFDEQENKSVPEPYEEKEEFCADQLYEIGSKVSTGGWFVSEGEAVLLAHDDGSCTYYDITNSEVKSVYKPPADLPNNIFRDCWLIRAPGVDGCSGRYVVAASAGNTLDSGFCSWDFYTRDVKAFHVEDESSLSSMSSSRAVLAPITNSVSSRRSSSFISASTGGQQWWYRPCGPLVISTASMQKAVRAHDIRDGELVLNWEVSSLVTGMEYTSPLQWRSRGKVVIAETDGIRLWDVNSLHPEALLSVSYGGKKVHSMHINNGDAELGGGVRQRVSSSELDGNDGVFCTQDSINVLDFRLEFGVGHKISRTSANALSVFAKGDNIFIGSTESRLSLKNSTRSCIQHYSIRKGRLVSTYTLPESNAHFHYSSLTQVWGNSTLVMGSSGMGLFVFDAAKDEQTLQLPLNMDRGGTVEVKDTIGPNDLYRPTFDYVGSRALLISRDRPAMWRYLL